ncbi:hypothetical protein V1289_010058 [Bradyrhizobium sp. AZCC 2289]
MLRCATFIAQGRPSVPVNLWRPTRGDGTRGCEMAMMHMMHGSHMRMMKSGM